MEGQAGAIPVAMLIGVAQKLTNLIRELPNALWLLASQKNHEKPKKLQ